MLAQRRWECLELSSKVFALRFSLCIPLPPGACELWSRSQFYSFVLVPPGSASSSALYFYKKCPQKRTKLFQSLFSEKNITSLSSLFLLLKYLLLLFRNYCAYVGALFNTSSLVKAQCFSGLLQVEAGEEGLPSRKFWPFIQAKNCQRSLKIKSRNVFKIMAGVCFSSDSFHSQKWLFT